MHDRNSLKFLILNHSLLVCRKHDQWQCIDIYKESQTFRYIDIVNTIEKHVFSFWFNFYSNCWFENENRKNVSIYGFVIHEHKGKTTLCFLHVFILLSNMLTGALDVEHTDLLSAHPSICCLCYVEFLTQPISHSYFVQN